MQISVIIPTFNSAEYIRETLESAVSQTRKPFEIIVADDGSTDQTKRIIHEFFMKYSTQKNILIENSHSGAGANRNTGIWAARGEWIAFLDSDDQWFPQKLERVRAFIEKDPDVDLWCHSEIADLGHRKKELRYFQCYDTDLHPFLNLYRHNCLSTSAVVVRKSCLLDVGGFDPQLTSGQDYDLWLRMAARKIRIGFIKDMLGVYNVRDGNLSSNPVRRLKCMLRIRIKARSILKQLSRQWIFEELFFLGNAFLSCGFVLMSQRHYIKGGFFVMTGLLIWPFQKEFFVTLKRKLLGERTDTAADGRKI